MAGIILDGSGSICGAGGVIVYTSIIEFLAIVLFLGGFWHAARTQGSAFAQQWFVAGYLTALIRETLNQILFQTYVFAPGMLRLGVSPALITLLSAGVAYLAYHFALRFVDANKPALVAGLVFVIAASFALPIEATAAQSQWWLYTIPVRRIFGTVPLLAPLVWGGGAAIFYAVFWRVAQSRLPDRGRLYLLVTLAPVMAAAQLLLVVLLNG
jgi:hypothetical protein